jgi:hypothetical protein
MTEKAPPRSVWTDLPEFEKIRAWQRAVPDAADRILRQLEEDARYFRRNGLLRLLCAMGIILLTVAATVVLALFDKVVPALFTSSGGTVGVATTLITGRSPALVRRKRAR